MSHASLENAIAGNSEAWKNDNRLSLAGTSDIALSFFLNKHTTVKEIVFGLDNDAAGREASGIMAKKYADDGYSTRIEVPRGKDFNDDLIALKTQKKAEKRTQNNHYNMDI
jgi:hypothetical protein